MKFTIEKPLFLKTLNHGQSVVEKKTTIPILSHVMLTASPEGLSLTTTDMDMALIETVPARVDAPGTLCVSAHLLYDIVRKLSDRNPIVVETNAISSQIVITSGRSRFELSYLPSEDFPQITQGELSHRFTLSTSVLKDMVDQTKFAMATEETRYNLNGIFFHTQEVDGQLVLRSVATDLHRLACRETEAPLEAKGMPEIIVGRKAITESRKLFDEAGPFIEVGLSQNRIEFVIQGEDYRAVFSSRLIDGSFPDYQSALSLENDKQLIVPTKDFAEALDRVGTVVSDKVRAVKIALQNNTATISAVSSELGSALEELDVDFPYDDRVELCFNVRYVLDVAGQIAEDEMQFMIADADAPAIVRPVNRSDAAYVLMPLRV